MIFWSEILQEDKIMNTAALKYMIDGSILQSVKVPSILHVLLMFELRKGSQAFFMSVEPDDIHTEVYPADGLDEFKELIGQQIVSFDIESGETVMEDDSLMGWNFYKFQGERDSATLRFNSYADQYYSVGVDIKCDKIETDKL